MDDDAELRNKEDRKKWMEERHYTPPHVDWREVEKANGEAQRIKRNRIARERARLGQMAMTSSMTTSPWQERGSDNLAGRMHVAVHAPDGQSIYAGTSLGGVWHGSPDGTNWTPIGDNIYGGAHWLVVFPGASAMDPDVVLRGTDGGLVSVTRDLGSTWDIPSGLPANMNKVYRMVVTADGNDTIFLVVGYRIGGVNYSEVYRSTDAAQSFSLVLDIGAWVGDLWVSRTGPGSVYALTGEGVKASSDNGDTWLTMGPLPMVGIGRGELAGSEAGAPRLWAVIQVNNNPNDFSLYRSDDVGVSWSFQVTVTKYWRTVAASIVDVDLFAWGGLEVQRTADGGASFAKVNGWGQYYSDPANKLHADIPGMDVVPCAIDPITCPDGEIWYISTDGGVYRSLDGMVTVENLSLDGLRVSQYYSTLTSALDSSHVAGGSQDQGYQWTDLLPEADGLLSLDQLISGDYGHLTSGDGSHSYVYATYPGFMLVQVGETNPLIRSAQFPPDVTRAWMPPVTADPLDNESVFFLATKLFRYTKDAGANTWSYVQWSPFDFENTLNEYLSALAFSPFDAQKVYAATRQGRFFYSTDHAVSWQESSTLGPRPHYFYGTALLASNTTPDTVYVGGSGYLANPVWRSIDGGVTYEPYGEGLPNTLVFCLAEAGDGSGTMYAGTNTAAYRRDAGSATWIDITGDEAPVTTYWSCETVPADGVIRFGTYGRGMWDYDYTTILPCNDDGICGLNENCTGCPNDCISGPGSATCGNGLCETADGEDCYTCAADCRGKTNGNVRNHFCCGDSGSIGVNCGDDRCTSRSFACTDQPVAGYCCGDSVCGGAEDDASCAIDCGAQCGDGFCDAGEDPCSCESDCGTFQNPENSCADSIDNDCDSLIDGNDPDCQSGCVPTSNKEKGPKCSDGLDNDCDGAIDGDDPDCSR